ncbi:MAG: hypothetical protein Q7S00_02555, partial [bacterium]|nr:hypothetical protein [bacterium]
MKTAVSALIIALGLLLSPLANALTLHDPLPNGGISVDGKWCHVRYKTDVDSRDATLQRTLRDRIERHNKVEGAQCTEYIFFLFANETILIKYPLEIKDMGRTITNPDETVDPFGLYINGYDKRLAGEPLESLNLKISALDLVEQPVEELEVVDDLIEDDRPTRD